ncbi:MAG TPA: hypothetical protein V6D17_13225 [Candidatus Obscuribacterales bacterium]
MEGSLNLCQAGTGQEQDWQSLYDTAFPATERTPKEELLKLLAAGSILLHRTTNKNNELLCFSIVYPMSNFALLSYIATDQSKRSSGVGSKHMKKLVELLKQKYPSYLGLVLEIESTKQPGLDAQEKQSRQRRLAFYQRLRAKRLCKTYVWPSYSQKGSYHLAELLWIDFDPQTIDDDNLPGIIRELYQKGYGAAADDPILELVINQFTCADKQSAGKKVTSLCQPELTPAKTDDKSKAENPPKTDGKPEAENPPKTDGKPESENPPKTDGKPEAENPPKTDADVVAPVVSEPGSGESASAQEQGKDAK